MSESTIDLSTSMPFEISCPGVLELPDRNIQFFNLWDDASSPGSRTVMVAVSDDDVVEMHTGDVATIGEFDIVIDRLDDPSVSSYPIAGRIYANSGGHHEESAQDT